MDNHLVDEMSKASTTTFEIYNEFEYYEEEIDSESEECVMITIRENLLSNIPEMYDEAVIGNERKFWMQAINDEYDYHNKYKTSNLSNAKIYLKMRR